MKIKITNDVDNGAVGSEIDQRRPLLCINLKLDTRNATSKRQMKVIKRICGLRSDNAPHIIPRRMVLGAKRKKERRSHRLRNTTSLISAISRSFSLPRASDSQFHPESTFSFESAYITVCMQGRAFDCTSRERQGVMFTRFLIC